MAQNLSISFDGGYDTGDGFWRYPNFLTIGSLTTAGGEWEETSFNFACTFGYNRFTYATKYIVYGTSGGYVQYTGTCPFLAVGGPRGKWVVANIHYKNYTAKDGVTYEKYFYCPRMVAGSIGSTGTVNCQTSNRIELDAGLTRYAVYDGAY